MECMYVFYLQHAPLQLAILHAWRDHCIQYLRILYSTLNSVAVRVLIILILFGVVHIVDGNEF